MIIQLLIKRLLVLPQLFFKAKGYTTVLYVQICQLVSNSYAYNTLVYNTFFTVKIISEARMWLPIKLKVVKNGIAKTCYFGYDDPSVRDQC